MIFATGSGVSFATFQILAMSNIDKSQEGIASGIINTSRYVGIPLGLAVLVAISNFTFTVGAILIAISALFIYFIVSKEEKK